MVKCSLTIMIVVAVVLSLMAAGGCGNHAQSGSAIGALMGAGIGQLVGHDSESTVIGAAIGGATGYMLGNESDKRESQAEITRLCKGEYYNALPTQDQLRQVYGFSAYMSDGLFSFILAL